VNLAYRAARAGGTLPAVLNAANEVAVAAFLEGRLTFVAIPAVIERAMDAHAPRPIASLDDVLAADAEGRRLAERAVAGAIAERRPAKQGRGDAPRAAPQIRCRGH
jgi:1-deoxy-D-xylulose-5-phosphate reductoisomerase